MSEVITLGETMAVFVPEETGSLQYVHDFQLHHAGTESNTAIGLCKLGHSTSWFSSLGNDQLGQYILSAIRSEGVDVSHVIINPNYPTGLMIKSFKHSHDTEIFYYRQNSAASHMQAADIKYQMFSGCKIIHLTGITPVLSNSCQELVFAVLKTAQQNGLKISFDPNIRKKLWAEVDYLPMFKEIISYTNILLMGLDEADSLFQERDPELLKQILFSYPQLEYLGLKAGSIGAYVQSRTDSIFIPPYQCSCIDSVGAGDAFNAGFLAGILEGKSLQECGQMAAITGALCTETKGDIEGIPTRQEVEQILNHKHITYR